MEKVLHEIAICCIPVRCKKAIYLLTYFLTYSVGVWCWKSFTKRAICRNGEHFAVSWM